VKRPLRPSARRPHRQAVRSAQPRARHALARSIPTANQTAAGPGTAGKTALRRKRIGGEARPAAVKHLAEHLANRIRLHDAYMEAWRKGQLNQMKEVRGEIAAANAMRKLFPEHKLAFGFKRGSGYDQVYVRPGDGTRPTEIIIVEAKGGRYAILGRGAKIGNQMGTRWVWNHAMRLMKNGTDQAQRDLGRQIIEGIRDGNARVIGRVLHGPDGAFPKEVQRFTYKKSDLF
jgi:hypothetical protein